MVVITINIIIITNEASDSENQYYIDKAYSAVFQLVNIVPDSAAKQTALKVFTGTTNKYHNHYYAFVILFMRCSLRSSTRASTWPTRAGTTARATSRSLLLIILRMIIIIMIIHVITNEAKFMTKHDLQKMTKADLTWYLDLRDDKDKGPKKPGIKMKRSSMKMKKQELVDLASQAYYYRC